MRWSCALASEEGWVLKSGGSHIDEGGIFYGLLDSIYDSCTFIRKTKGYLLNTPKFIPFLGRILPANLRHQLAAICVYLGGHFVVR